MFDFIRFWLVIEIFGLLGLPLAWRLFRFLPDRGYAFAKALGLLGVGYLLWLGAMFGLLRNSAGGVVLAMLLFAGLGLWLSRKGWQTNAEGRRPLLAHLRANWRYALGVEAFFFLAMAAWAFFRAYNPDIAGTEKPMEIAFLNGILNSPQFPPRDPWLAGFGISYYYFGYVQLNSVVLLSGVLPEVGFNLGLAALFALTLLGAFGVVYNLVRGDERRPASSPKAALFALFGSLLAGIMGNLEGVLEALHARGLLSPAALAFFDVKELATAPVTGTWNPGAYWWWWRASRVIHDYNFSRTMDQEVISEFPIFSFLLGDVHPHVLALPFVLLVIGLALNLLRRPALSFEQEPRVHEEDGRSRLWRQAWNRMTAVFGMDGLGLPIYGLMLGALGFLNTWDFPIYLFLMTLVYALRRGLNRARLDADLWREIALAFVSLAAIGFVGYLPFYLSFSSQARGVFPNFYNPTRFVQYFLMFGPFLAAIFFLLLASYRRFSVSRGVLLRWIAVVLLLPALFLGFMLLTAYLVPGLRTQAEQILGIPAAQIIPAILQLRVLTPGTWLAVGLLLAFIAALASLAWSDKSEKKPGRELVFVLALFFTALLLTYGVEFVFLRDTFGTRMNTVFKFYYQAWLMMAVGSAYALYYLATRASKALRAVSFGIVALLVLGGLVYPTLAIPNKANNFQGEPSLNGARFVAIFRPDEAAVIAWLRQNTPPDAVIVEAPGGSYSDFNTISAHTGRATLLGWGGHELQWRGTYDEPGRREPLIEAIYRNQDPDRVRQIVEEFGIDYLIVGPREIAKYKISPATQRSYLRLWEPVFQDGNYTVYAWRG